MHNYQFYRQNPKQLQCKNMDLVAMNNKDLIKYPEPVHTKEK